MRAVRAQGRACFRLRGRVGVRVPQGVPSTSGVAMALERRNHGRGHSYWIDGTKVPGITTVLREGIPSPQFAIADVRKAAAYAVDHWDELAEEGVATRLQRIEKAPRAALTQAGVRGTHVHTYAEQLQAGQEVEVPDEYAGMVDAYLAFVREWDPREVVVERPVFHRRLMYAGTPDLVADLADGQRWLLDWKTSASGIWPEYALQLAAARYAEVVLHADGSEAEVSRLGIEACGCVHLVADGSYELRPVEAGPDAFRVFAVAMQMARYKATTREDWVGDASLPPTKER